jgi:transcriptional regulator with GAF, ATPase, and Fis domain
LSHRRELTVLILGETGTGKELSEPFMPPVLGHGGSLLLNCAAIPTACLKARLRTRRRFTGVIAQRIGRLSRPTAERFLDEVGGIPSSQTGRRACSKNGFERLGSTRTLRLMYA